MSGGREATNDIGVDDHADKGDGWVTVQLCGALSLIVRASSIEAVQFTDVQPVRKQLDFAFDLGSD